MVDDHILRLHGAFPCVCEGVREQQACSFQLLSLLIPAERSSTLISPPPSCFLSLSVTKGWNPRLSASGTLGKRTKHLHPSGGFFEHTHTLFQMHALDRFLASVT